MTARRIVEELGRGPLARQEWRDIGEDGDCVNCPIRRDVEEIETRNGNVLLVILTAMAVGGLIGFLVGVSL